MGFPFGIRRSDLSHSSENNTITTSRIAIGKIAVDSRDEVRGVDHGDGKRAAEGGVVLGEVESS